MHSQKKHRHLAAAAGSLTVLVLALSACSSDKQAAAAKTPEVTVMTAHRTNVPRDIELPGRTTAYLVAQVRARVDGIVQKRAFEEGADVRADQPLYQIDPKPYQAALDSAKATLQKNQATLVTDNAQLERYKVLVAANAVSKQLYDNAVAAQGQAAADVAAARAAVEMAQINLGYTAVNAPISGRSAVSLVTPGAYVQASAATLMTTVQQLDPIYVDLAQSSVQGLQTRLALASGQLKTDGPGAAKVSLTMEDGSTYPLAGKLQVSGVQVDPSTGTVALRVLFPNPQHVLLPGMFVRARVDQGIQQNIFLLPEEAVSHNRKGESLALVVGTDHKVVEKIIKTNDLVNNQWVIESGLNDGDQVIVDGKQKVAPGILVTTVTAPPAAANVAMAAASPSTSSTAK
jgi:membrane fusion protein (multidrug efflux system)